MDMQVIGVHVWTYVCVRMNGWTDGVYARAHVGM